MKLKVQYKILLIILTILVLYLFWGPLFPWNPIKIGFTEINTLKANIFIKNISKKDSALYKIDEIIQNLEGIHDLEFQSDFKIIVLDRDSDMKRYLPWMSGSQYSVSLSVIDLIYIGPIARKSNMGIEPYIKHELSHLLIDQNTTFENAREIHNQGWFTEGLAEYAGNRSFYSKENFIKICKSENIEFTDLREKSPLDMSNDELKFNYSFYRFFIEFLIETYGIEKFQKYLKRYIEDPKQHIQLLDEVFRIELEQLLTQFNSRLNR